MNAKNANEKLLTTDEHGYSGLTNRILIRVIRAIRGEVCFTAHDKFCSGFAAKRSSLFKARP